MWRLAIGLVLAFAACGNQTHEFPPGLEPLEENQAPLPEPSGQVQYPEELLFEVGNDGYLWVHGRGYVQAPIADVWEAIQDPAVIASRRKDPDYKLKYDVEPGYDLSFSLQYQVEDVITVDWRENWRYGALEGTFDAPEWAMVRYQKVWGSVFIDLLEGSIQLLYVDENTTEIQLIEHLDAAGGSSSDLTRAMNDRLESIRAQLDGEPLPEW